jgi:hypothetical protein
MCRRRCSKAVEEASEACGTDGAGCLASGPSRKKEEPRLQLRGSGRVSGDGGGTNTDGMNQQAIFLFP